uniref:Dim1 n=1 Tax=Prorocentrum minimum TaxID=39449 RepID=E8Z6T4_PROMN|nr:Dim1 [Prorocentrum minimum]
MALPSLHTTFSIDQAVMGEENQNKVVCLRMGRDFDPDCMMMDEVLKSAQPTVEPLCAIYTVDVREVPQCIQEFQLAGPSPIALMFFFRGRPIQLDLGEGKRGAKITWALGNQQEFLDLCEAFCRGAQQGREVVTAPRDYSVQGRY